MIFGSLTILAVPVVGSYILRPVAVKKLWPPTVTRRLGRYNSVTVSIVDGLVNRRRIYRAP